MFGPKIPQSIFVHADSFLRAGTQKSDPPNPYDMIALVTNSGFASELYLKCLIHIERGQLVKKEHNLKKLFAMLSKETQLTIQQRFDAVMAQQKDMTLQMHLKKSKKGLARWPKTCLKILWKL